MSAMTLSEARSITSRSCGDLAVGLKILNTVDEALAMMDTLDEDPFANEDDPKARELTELIQRLGFVSGDVKQLMKSFIRSIKAHVEGHERELPPGAVAGIEIGPDGVRGVGIDDEEAKRMLDMVFGSSDPREVREALDRAHDDEGKNNDDEGELPPDILRA